MCSSDLLGMKFKTRKTDDSEKEETEKEKEPFVMEEEKFPDLEEKKTEKMDVDEKSQGSEVLELELGLDVYEDLIIEKGKDK